MCAIKVWYNDRKVSSKDKKSWPWITTTDPQSLAIGQGGCRTNRDLQRGSIRSLTQLLLRLKRLTN